MLEPIRASLDGLLEIEAGGYRQGEDGRWHLHPEIVELQERHAAELAEIDRLPEIAKRRQRALARVEARAGYGAALAAAGVKPQYIPAAIAMLAEQSPVELDERLEPFAKTPYGRATLAGAVANFLASEAGAPFVPAQPGPYAAEIARLRSVR